MSTTWDEAVVYIGKQIDRTALHLQQRGLEQMETEYLRGVISAYREILQLPDLTAADHNDRSQEPPFMDD